MAETIAIPLEVIPQIGGTGVGNCYNLTVQRTNRAHDVLNFIQNQDGKAYGRCRIPDNMAATPNAHIILWLGVNDTAGDMRWIVGTRIVGDSDTLDGSYTNETARDITIDATALDLMVERFPSAGALATSFTGAAGKLLDVFLFHEGSHVNETIDTDVELVDAFLMIDVE